MSRYIVNCFDRLCVHTSTRHDDFDACLDAVRRLAAMYPGKRIIVFGLEQEDESFNGLTLEQQAAVDEAVAMGRWNSVGRSA